MTRLAQYSTAVICLWLALVSGASAQLPSARSSSLLGSDRPQPLPIETAFPFFVSYNSTEGVSVSWQPAAEHYLYRHRFAFELKAPDSNLLLPVNFSLPDGVQKQDEFFGDIEAYYNNVVATLDIPSDQLAGSVLIIQFQGCADWGFCYPPQAVEYPLIP